MHRIDKPIRRLCLTHKTPGAQKHLNCKHKGFCLPSVDITGIQNRRCFLSTDWLTGDREGERNESN